MSGGYNDLLFIFSLFYFCLSVTIIMAEISAQWLLNVYILMTSLLQVRKLQVIPVGITFKEYVRPTIEQLPARVCQHRRGKKCWVARSEELKKCC